MKRLALITAVIPAALLLSGLFAASASACGDEELHVPRAGNTEFNPNCGSQIPVSGEDLTEITSNPSHGTLTPKDVEDDQYVWQYTVTEPNTFQGLDQFTYEVSNSTTYTVTIKIGLPDCDWVARESDGDISPWDFNFGGAPGAAQVICDDPDGEPVTTPTVHTQPAQGSLGSFSIYSAIDSEYCALYTPPASGTTGLVPYTVNISDGRPDGNATSTINTGIRLVDGTPARSWPNCDPSPDPNPDPDPDPNPGPGPGPGPVPPPVGPPPVGPPPVGPPPVGPTNPFGAPRGLPGGGPTTVAGTQRASAGQVAGSTFVNYNGSTVQFNVTGTSGPAGSIARTVALGSAVRRNVRRGRLRWAVRLSRAGKAALAKGLRRKTRVKVRVRIVVTPPAAAGGRRTSVTKTVTLRR